jgi:hypothetical protein
MIRVPPKVVRRVVLAPLVLALSLAVVVASPALVVLAVVADVFVGGRRTLRVVTFGAVYCAYEVMGIVAVFWLWIASGAGLRIHTPAAQERHYRLMAWWLRGLRGIGTRLFHVEVVIEDRPPPQAGPVLVFSRHGGAGNSLMLVATLMLEYDRHPRIIMLEKLQWEPLFDVLLNRLPNRFIRHGAKGRDTQIEAIGALATGLGGRDASVLFPEGHDFRPDLRVRAIDHLRKRGHVESAERAERMANVLPPRHGGVMAAIANAPDADICFVAHTLFEDVGSLGQLWARIPLDEPVSARFWRIPCSSVPQDADELIAWLYGWWSRIDAWISDKTTQLHPHEEAIDLTAEAPDPSEPLL